MESMVGKEWKGQREGVQERGREGGREGGRKGVGEIKEGNDR